MHKSVLNYVFTYVPYTSYMFRPLMWPRLQGGALHYFVMRLLEDGHMGGRNM